MTDPGRLEVRGGAGGVSARLADVERAGALLHAGAARLADHGRAVVAASIDPRLQLTAPLSPMTFARAEAALAAATWGPGGLFALAARAELLGSSALTVAAGYRMAEVAVTESLRAAAVLTGRSIGGALAAVVPPGLLLGAASVLTVVLSQPDRGSDPASPARPDRPPHPDPLRRTGGLALRLLAGQGALIEAAVPVLPGVIGGFLSTVPGGPVIAARIFGHPAGPVNVADVAVGLGAIGPQAAAATGTPPWFRDSNGPNGVQVRVAPAPGQRPPAGAADLLGRIPAADTGRPVIHVERVDGVAGRRRVVWIPGTANWSPIAGATPFDLTGNIQLMAGARSAAMAGVVEAMRVTGVRNGEPVLLVGYSQGGLIAAGLAADPSVRHEFSVHHVLTSAAPIASVPIPDDVQVLSIEHTDDPIPRLDGSANRDRPNWITVTAPAPTASASPTDLSEPLLAHRGGLYRSTAERIDQSTHPSIVRWRAEVAPFLARSDGPSAGWDVDVSRVGAP